MKLIDAVVEKYPIGTWPAGMLAIGPMYTFNAFVGRKIKDDEYVTREQYEAALAASKPEWNGEGLPPVGCECEYETKFDGWQPVRIELIKSEGIAFTWLSNSQAYNGLDCVGVRKSGSFRPTRSEAERKRDEAVKEFVRQIIECVDLHAADKRNIDIVREKLYSMLPTLPGVTVID